MSKADIIYNFIIQEIIEEGLWDKDHQVRTKWKDGTFAYTKSLLNVQMKFDKGKEIPILTSKRVPTKDPVNEVFWIWKFKSNNVKILREALGCNVCMERMGKRRWNHW